MQLLPASFGWLWLIYVITAHSIHLNHRSLIINNWTCGTNKDHRGVSGVAQRLPRNETWYWTGDWWSHRWFSVFFFTLSSAPSPLCGTCSLCTSSKMAISATTGMKEDCILLPSILYRIYNQIVAQLSQRRKPDSATTTAAVRSPAAIQLDHPIKRQLNDLTHLTPALEPLFQRKSIPMELIKYYYRFPPSASQPLHDSDFSVANSDVVDFYGPILWTRIKYRRPQLQTGVEHYSWLTTKLIFPLPLPPLPIRIEWNLTARCELIHCVKG